MRWIGWYCSWKIGTSWKICNQSWWRHIGMLPCRSLQQRITSLAACSHFKRTHTFLLFAWGAMLMNCLQGELNWSLLETGELTARVILPNLASIYWAGRDNEQDCWPWDSTGIELFIFWPLYIWEYLLVQFIIDGTCCLDGLSFHTIAWILNIKLWWLVMWRHMAISKRIKQEYLNEMNWLILFLEDWHIMKSLQAVLMKAYWHAGLQELATKNYFPQNGMQSLQENPHIPSVCLGSNVSQLIEGIYEKTRSHHHWSWSPGQVE